MPRKTEPVVTSMMYSSKFTMPWHGIGANFTGDVVTSAEAMRLADLNPVSKVPLYAGAMGAFVPVEGKYGIMRRVGGEMKCIGTVGSEYEVYQPESQFNFFDNLVSEGYVTYVTAGSMEGGALDFLTAKVMGDPLEIVPGDVMDKYLIGVNSHNGTKTIQVGSATTAIVCKNTMMHALNEAKKDSKWLQVKHTKNAGSRLDLIKDILGFKNETLARFERTAKQLAAQKMKVSEFKNLATFITCGKKEWKDDLTPAVEQSVDNLVELFRNGPGADMRGQTGYGALQAFVAHQNHVVSSTSVVEKPKYTLLGQGDEVVQKVYVTLQGYYQLAA